MTIDITGIENKISEENLNNSELLFDVLTNEVGLEFGDCVSVIDVIEFNNYKFPTNFQETYDAMCAKNQAQVERMNANKVHCPYCKSTNVKKLSGTTRVTSVLAFGIGSKKVGKQWHCNNCKSDF